MDKLIDCHVHIRREKPDIAGFAVNLNQTNTAGAFVFSLPPENSGLSNGGLSNRQRLDDLLEFCRDNRNLYPFYWLDPTEDDAARQIEDAVAVNVSGFKVICSHFYPSDPAAMARFRLIAQQNKCILFHSGILWDGRVSSKFCHPLEYECLLEVDYLRFALAHVSWPWHDTAIALYGKFLNATKRNINCEMFIETTPGTPEIYRDEVLTKLYTVGYGIADNVMFGTDSSANGYNANWCSVWRKRDTVILNKINIGQENIRKYFHDNAIRFVSGTKISKELPKAGE